MMALTVKQPWAWAIVHNTKRVENRTWKPPFHIIGKRIAIHASAKLDRLEMNALRGLGIVEPPVGLPLGCFIGTAIVVGYSVVDGNRLVEQSKGAQGYNPRNDPWFCGPIGWLLADRQPCPLIPAKGKLNLWQVPPEIERQIHVQP